MKEKEIGRELILDVDIAAFKTQINELMELLVPGTFCNSTDFIDHFLKVRADVCVFNFSKTITTDDAFIIRVGVFIPLEATISAMRASKSKSHD